MKQKYKEIITGLISTLLSFCVTSGVNFLFVKLNIFQAIFIFLVIVVIIVFFIYFAIFKISWLGERLNKLEKVISNLSDKVSENFSLLITWLDNTELTDKVGNSFKQYLKYNSEILELTKLPNFLFALMNLKKFLQLN